MGVYGLWFHTWGDPAVAMKAKPKRVHKATPREVIATQIESLEGGKEVVYQLGAIYIKPFITVVRNESYPVKGKEFIVYQESKAADGTPSGNRGKFWDASKPLDVAKWLLEREGKLYRSQAPVTTSA